MISREEAHRKRNSENSRRCFNHSYMYRQIEDIYDSIGTCDECHYLKKDEGVYYCKLVRKFKSKEGFCDEFKKSSE
jgi:hypothetical protein